MILTRMAAKAQLAIYGAMRCSNAYARGKQTALQASLVKQQTRMAVLLARQTGVMQRKNALTQDLKTAQALAPKPPAI